MAGLANGFITGLATHYGDIKDRRITRRLHVPYCEDELRGQAQASPCDNHGPLGGASLYPTVPGDDLHP